MTETITQDGTERIAATSNKRAKRAEVSRQQILDVAAKLFRARGYTETSLRDIGKQVGMKAGSLYYHFTSKEELAAEVLRIGVRRDHEVGVLALDGLRSDATGTSRARA